MKNANSKNFDNNRSPKITSALFALLFALGGAAVLSGCEDQGPAEEAGEEIDEAVEDAGDEIDDAAEEAGDAVQEAAEEVEEETDGI